jgi:Uma2 family endonuclease
LLDKTWGMLIVEGHKIKNYSEHMTDEELYDFCMQNKGLRVERDGDQNIIIMSPVGGESGFFEKNFIFELELWARQHKKGLTFSSSTGFLLPNGAMRSPDACWVSEERWKEIQEDQKQKFMPVVPDFIVEIKSPEDALKDLKLKMKEWVDNGAQLGWLIDPKAENVFVFRSEKVVEKINSFDQILSGEDILPGFKFDLKQLKLP